MVGSRQEEFAELLRNTKDMSRFESGLDVGFRSCSDLWHYLENTAVLRKSRPSRCAGAFDSRFRKGVKLLDSEGLYQ